MNTVETVEAIARCDLRVAEARASLREIAGSRDPDHFRLSEVLRQRIDLHLDLRNIYAEHHC